MLKSVLCGKLAAYLPGSSKMRMYEMKIWKIFNDLRKKISNHFELLEKERWKKIQKKKISNHFYFTQTHGTFSFFSRTFHQNEMVSFFFFLNNHWKWYFFPQFQIAKLHFLLVSNLMTVLWCGIDDGLMVQIGFGINF